LKRYRVIITPAAEAEALAAFEYIRSRSPANAARWLRGLYGVTSKLEQFPGHGRAPEGDFLDCDLRQVNFKSYRVLYSVDEAAEVVHVHSVRHAARRGLGEPGDQE